MAPSIIDDDDEAHFSHSSGRTIKPFRPRQKEHRYLGTLSNSSVSSSSGPSGAGLDSRLSKTEVRTKYLLNIIKLMVPWKRDIDEWRTQEEMAKIDKISSPPTQDPSLDEGSEAPFPVPPSEPPSYNIPSSQAMHYFPSLPAHIANFDHSAGRLLRDTSAPPSPSRYTAPREAQQTLEAILAERDGGDGTSIQLHPSVLVQQRCFPGATSRSRTVPARPQRPRRSSDMPSPSLEQLQLQLQDRQEPQYHDDIAHSVLRLRLHPHPSLAQTHQRVATVSLCYHNSYWTSPGLCDETFHFYGHGRVYHVRESHPAPLPAPSPPNYVIECDDVNLWPSEDEDDSDISSSPSQPPPPPEPPSSTSRVSALFNGNLILWSILGLILFATQPSPLSKRTLLERYHHICLQETTLARETVNNVEIKGYVKALRPYFSTILTSCSEIYKIGKVWDEKNGLTMQDGWEYGEYRRTNKNRPLPDGGIHNIDLCHPLRRRVDLVDDVLLDVIYAIVYQLPGDSQHVFQRLIC
ncbi:hypothetical protein FGADI_5422 [Fusarium gaditjirri]|uniref:Uncharacterized protein n=1 Tax=Fusarium gaditjirri TaxID=282569 RepID=A0A8H4TAE1_9HYPO|nr:hypothetical protein FGADI_5422 [Fusarium gaditjirri]